MKSFYSMLAESLTSKYITEAWSDSMPDWMKKRLQATAGFTNLKAADQKMRNSKVYKRAKAQAEAEGNDEYMANKIATEIYNKNKTGTFYPITPDYQSPRKDAWRSDNTKNLFAEFYNKGIDLSNPDIKFIEGDPPTSARDARVQPPNIPIWRIPVPDLSDAQVYAKGINDLEKLFWSVDAGTYSDASFKDISVKKLSELCDHFCYIDGSTIKYMDAEKIPARKAYDTWQNSPEGNQITRHKEAPGNSIVDKSGYVVIPPAIKYANELKRLHAKKYAEKLMDLETILNNVYDQFTKSLSSLSFEDMSTAVMYRPFANSVYSYTHRFTQHFQAAVDTYKKILSVLDTLKQEGLTEDEFLDNLIIYDIDSQINRSLSFAHDALTSLGDMGIQQLDF